MRVLITGVTGQDGWYLSRQCWFKGHEVHGLVRRTSRKAEVAPSVILHEGDMTDAHSLYRVIDTVRPEIVFNLAAQSFVGTSWEQPELTTQVNYLGVLHLLEACRQLVPGCYFLQASTSEMWGNEPHPQNEQTHFDPQSPYAIAKVAAHHLVLNYRKHLTTGITICANHESPRRGVEFVTQKIVLGLLQLKLGLSNELRLGNLAARRDWGYAPEYTEAMLMMAEQRIQDVLVLATGQQHSVETFLQMACDTVGIERSDPRIIVDAALYRPAEVHLLCGDSSKAERVLGWKAKTDLRALLQRMVTIGQLRLTKKEIPEEA